jgi:hypothetical protein
MVPEIPYVQHDTVSIAEKTQVLIDVARRILNLCAFESIFLEVLSTSDAALTYMINSLITFIQRRSLSSGGTILSNMWILDEEIASVSVRMLVSVVSCNGFRLNLVWPRVFEQFTGMLKDARQLTPALQEVSIGMTVKNLIPHSFISWHFRFYLSFFEVYEQSNGGIRFFTWVLVPT